MKNPILETLFLNGPETREAYKSGYSKVVFSNKEYSKFKSEIDSVCQSIDVKIKIINLS